MLTRNIVVVVCALTTACRSQTTTQSRDDLDITETTYMTSFPDIGQHNLSYDSDVDSEETEDGMVVLAGSVPYIVLIVAGFVAVPMLILLRICYTRGLKRNLEEVQVGQASQSEQNQSQITMSTIDNECMNFPVIPTYEQSVSSPVSESPPAYNDLPPCYSDVIMADNGKYDKQDISTSL